MVIDGFSISKLVSCLKLARCVMKKILLIAVIIGLVGCGKSEAEKLEAKVQQLATERQKYTEIGDKLSPQCEKATKEYQDAFAAQSANMDDLKEKGRDVCTKAFEAQNKALELQDEIMKIRFQMIAEENK